MNKEVLLAYFSKTTYRKYQSLCNTFGSIEAAWSANEKELSSLPWKTETIQEFIQWKKTIDVGELQHNLEREKIHCIPISDPAYPPLLKHLYDPPVCLFVRGSLENYHLPLAVVGPRKYSMYGKHITETFVPELAGQKMSIISGLALGIDALAHTHALRVNGNTIAVLGSGVGEKSIHPRQHRTLANTIIEKGGAIISEFPPNYTATAYSFPQRNRIIAGLSLATFVIEASATSGALITAQYAIDIGRDVLTVPQNITSTTAAGANRLIQQGAHTVTNPQEIFCILGVKMNVVSSSIKVKELNETEVRICLCLSQEPRHIDDIAKSSGITSAVAASTLTMLEIRGRVKNLGNMMYILLS